MRPESFLNPETGRLVRTAKGNWAFVPAPLPPSISFDAELVLALSQADAALSELSGLGAQLPNPHLLIAPYARREAVLSSRIEGTRASLDDLFADELEASSDSDVREVANYVMALEHGIRRLDELPLSLRLVREIHEKLMSGVRGQYATPGEFRRSQNFIGPPGSTEETATYVPPPVPEMHDALDAWEKYLHAGVRLPDLVQCAIMHVQFEAIHPFIDGNGRVGRLLITLFLIQRKRLSQPLLYLSAFIEAHRADYYELLQRTHTQGDWRGWIAYFLAGVRVVAEDGCGQARELLALREQLRNKVRNEANALMLVDALFANPYLNIKRAAAILKKTYPTAKKAVEALAKNGIVSEISGRVRSKLYLAQPISDVITSKREF